MTISNELRLACRGWRRTPGLAAVAVMTLAFGIGVMTTAFTAAYALLVRPLPFPDADRLVWITTYDTRSPGDRSVTNSNRMPQFADWEQHLASFDRLAAWSGAAAPDVFTVTGNARPERISGLEITGQLLPMLGATPALGRLFGPADDRPGATPTVVLSNGYWQRRFAGRGDVIGTRLIIDNLPREIVGVVADGFPFTATLFAGAPVDVYLPLEVDPGRDLGAFMTVIGRLRPGVSPERARAELVTRQRAMAIGQRQWMTNLVQDVAPVSMLATRDARTPLLLLCAAVACVLVLACANLANLLLVRASGRRREMEVRTALGATTRHVLRQSVIESVVVAGAGTVVGIALAVVLTAIVRTFAPITVARLPEVVVGWTAVAFAAALGAVVTLLFGTIPLLYSGRGAGEWRAAQHASVPRRPARVQRFVLALQVALALTLTACGGLLMRSIIALLDVEPGFAAQDAIAMRVDPAGRIPLPERLRFFERVRAAVAEVAGVQAAALTINLPLDRDMGWDAVVPGQAYNPRTDAAFGRIVTPGYFRAAGVRLVEGRDFDDRDRRAAPAVVAINETLARQLTAAGRPPLQSTLLVNGMARRMVAVVADVRHRRLDEDAGREVYIPQAQAPAFFQAYDLVVRAANPLSVVPAIRQAIWRIDPQQAVGTPIELSQLVDRQLQPRRLLMWTLAIFGGVALVLAAAGVYALVAFRVLQRRKELAIRLALGSPGARVVATVMREAVLFVAVGIAGGLPLSMMAGAAVRVYLFGVGPHDAMLLITAAGVVISAALLAAYVPARRAPHIAPLASLRVD